MAARSIPDEVKAQVNEIVARFNGGSNDPTCYYVARFRGPYLYLDRSDFGQVGPICRLKYTGDMNNSLSVSSTTGKSVYASAGSRPSATPTPCSATTAAVLQAAPGQSRVTNSAGLGCNACALQLVGPVDQGFVSGDYDFTTTLLGAIM
jgi:hypothetical protein